MCHFPLAKSRSSAFLFADFRKLHIFLTPTFDIELSMAVRITLRYAPSFHAPRRCHLLHHHRPLSPRYSSEFSHLREEMTTRLTPYKQDYITPTQVRSLRLTLADFLPISNKARYKLVSQRYLNPTHHLVYFPSVLNASLLLPDGTESWLSPGAPFTRKMWAGGSMTFLQDIPVNGDPFHCTETISDVQVKGKEGEEKIYVRVERRIFPGKYPGELQGQKIARLHLSEQRTLVFMRDNRQEGFPAVSQTSSKALKPLQTPDFSHFLVPTRELLFRFSALTLNAHAIHLDKQFCREVEGYRNLLVHGPLTVVLMIEVLQTYLHRFYPDRPPTKTTYVEYRNLAPLYAEEEMKICVKRREKEADGGKTVTWDVWIEGQDGGYAVKGTICTVSDGRISKSRVGGAFHEHGTAPQEGGLDGESIPAEQMALQHAINAGHETASNEDGSLAEDFSPKEKIERETEDEAEDEAEDEIEEETAPYFQR